MSADIHTETCSINTGLDSTAIVKKKYKTRQGKRNDSYSESAFPCDIMITEEVCNNSTAEVDDEPEIGDKWPDHNNRKDSQKAENGNSKVKDNLDVIYNPEEVDSAGATAGPEVCVNPEVDNSPEASVNQAYLSDRPENGANREDAVEQTTTSATGVQKDQGRAWIIAFGKASLLYEIIRILMMGKCIVVVFVLTSLLSTFLCMGSFRALSLYMVELASIYDEPASKLSLIFFWIGIGFSGTACFYILGIGDLFHERILLMAGGISSFVAFLSAFFSTRLEHTYALGFFIGVTAQFGVTSSLSILGDYFEKRLSLANGIAMSGISLGTLAVPFFVQVLFEEYGYKGASLIMAGVTLNLFVCAALMEPAKPNRDSTRRKLPEPSSTNVPDDVQLETVLESGSVQSAEQPSVSQVNGHLQSYENKIFIGDSTDDHSSGNVGKTRNKYHFTRPSTTRTIPDQTSFADCFCKAIFKQSRVDSSKGAISKLKNLFSAFELFKDPAYILFQLFAITATLSSENIVQFYPSFVTELGLSQTEASFLISIIGACDILSRLIFGFLGDHVDRVMMVFVPLMTLGVVCLVTRFATEFWSQTLIASFSGLLYGSHYSVWIVLLIDYFGLARLSRTLGMASFLSGMGFIVGGPIIGKLKDISGSYALSLQFLAYTFFSSGLLIVGMKISRRCYKPLYQ